jgi:ppGpp synthetase/RelA/SpoT-type nucleotidyltranferase
MTDRKRKRKLDNDYSALEKEYGTVAPTAQNFADELCRQLGKLLDENDISLGFPMQARIKSWESLRGKLDRKSFKIGSVKELEDLIGLRIIVLFRRDLDRVTKILDAQFKIVKKEDTAKRLTENQFGYQSIHYILKLPNEWFALPTLKGMVGLQAEVQVRTVAQHIWAASSHVLQYKSESSVPVELRRTIHRVSALLETVDLEFERVVSENENYAAEVEVTEPDHELNVITLGKVLDATLPKQNKRPADPERYAQLLDELRASGIDTTGKLRKTLKKMLPKVLQLDKQIATELLKSPDFRANVASKNCVGKPEDKMRYERGVFWTHTGLIRQMIGELKAQS